MLILGIEGSANKLGIGILRDTNILSNLRKTYNPPTGKGFVPVEAADHHRSEVFNLIEESLKAANIKIEEIDLFCYTKGPGMHQLLRIGCIIFRTLSLLYKKPLIPVNHCIAHIEMGRLITKAKNPVVLYASGGNTQIISYNKQNKQYKIFGETLDIACGNCLDKVARELNLSNSPSPGHSIEMAARKGKNYIKFPYSIKGMDLSFGGIIQTLKVFQKEKTKEIEKKEIKQKGIKNNEIINSSSTSTDSLSDEEESYFSESFNENKKCLLPQTIINDLCFSIQETMFSMLVEGTERCLAFVDSNEVMIVGGVGCNLRLQEMIGLMIKQRGGTLHAMDERFCIDNGAMIAYTGYIMHQSGLKFTMEDCSVTQRFRTDEVCVEWKEE